MPYTTYVPPTDYQGKQLVPVRLHPISEPRVVGQQGTTLPQSAIPPYGQLFPPTRWFVNIVAPPIVYDEAILIGTFTSGAVGTPYIYDLFLAGGDGSWSNPRAVVGALPAWATLSIVGSPGAYRLRLSGVPTGSATTVDITVAVDSGDGQTATSAQSISIVDTYLDSLAVTPIVAFSLRKMMSAATKSMRVRRSSDGAEMDIGFVGKAFDSSTLATFAGAGNATVTKFYDQTGSGFDLAQPTSTKQPLIVSSGTVLPTAIFDRVDDFMKITGLTLGTPYVGVYLNAQMATSSLYSQMIVEAGTNYNTTAQSFAMYGTNIGPDSAAAMNNAAANTQRDCTLSYMPQSSVRQCTVLFDRSAAGSGEIAGRLQGSPVTPHFGSTNEQTGNFANNDIYVGARGGTSVFAALHLESMIIYSADTSAAVTAIEDMVE